MPTPTCLLSSIIRRHPAIRLTLALILGILVASHGIEMKPLWAGVISTGCLLGGLWLPALRGPAVVAGTAILIAIAWLGIGLYNLSLPRFQPDHFSHFLNGEEQIFLLRVEEVKNSRLIGEVLVLAQRQETRGRMIVYVRSDKALDEDLVHDLIVCKGRPAPIQAPRNPASFDFKTFYGNKHIYYQCFIEEEQWQVVEQDHRAFVWTVLSAIRLKAKEQLRRHVDEQHAFALLSALLLGDKRALDDDIKSAYADTGSMHVLAVSGLHVGVLFLILSYGLRFLPVVSRSGRLFKSLLICLGVWCFAMLSGASHSVLRAATMFTFFAIGGVVGRGQYSLNTLAVVAFILLILDPLSLFDVGFQLSFAAVTGIILLQGEIESLWKPALAILKYGWKLISLSLAAQLFTFPFVIYYFHQFPVYFWLSGLVVVPAAFVLLTAGSIFFTTHWIPILGGFAGFILGVLAQLTNKLIFLIQKLPYLEVQGIWPGKTEIILIATLIISVTFFLKLRKGTYLIYGLSLLLVIVVYKGFLHERNQSRLIFYHLPNQSYGEWIRRNTVYRLCNVEISKNNQQLIIRPYREKYGIDLSNDVDDEIIIENYEGYFNLEGAQIYFSKLDTVKGNLLEDLDIVIITDSFLENQLPTASNALFVLDSSLGYRKAMQWEERLSSGNFRFHNMYKEGAFEFILSKPTAL